MKKFPLLMVALLLSGLIRAQGIDFDESSNWTQIKEQAKAGQKYIFMDCYATWCGPCKAMEAKVYPLGKVGAFMNANFICVKVQLDTSAHDNDRTKRWYADARQIFTQYKINGVPTFLFFSPDGEIVHRDLGYKEEDAFMQMARDARDPGKQYYTLLRQYQAGSLDAQKMPHLAQMAKDMHDDVLANGIAVSYLENYLDTLSEDAFFTKYNMTFLFTFYDALRSGDRGFQLVYQQPERTNAALGQPSADRLINYIITKEEINAKIWNGKKPAVDRPDWKKITATIRKKYNSDYAEKNVLDAKIYWYDKKKDWGLDVRYNIEKIDKYGLDTTGWGLFYLNNMVWNVIFEHSTDKKSLHKAIGWMKIATEKDPTGYARIDTYANLLYKAGQKHKAMEIEQQALVLAEANKYAGKEEVDTYRKTLEKMDKDLPTWGDKN